MIRRLRRVAARFAALPEKINKIQEALGRIEQRQAQQTRLPIERSEFRVFSQWGEDGIIQYLITHVPIATPIFIEFGVENYTESNTRFLLVNDNWRGLVIDGSAEHIDYIRRDRLYWAHNLKAEHAFITRENINDLFRRNGITGDIGLLSVDIDGNDYWVWEAIDVVSPRIVVCEYNSHFGPEATVSTPYDPGFVRGQAHFSKIYYGASVAALRRLGEAKGYSLVASNTAANNLFFVRNDLLGTLPVLSSAAAYRRAAVREFHDPQGNLTFDDFDTRLRKIADLPLVDVTSGATRRVADVVEIGRN